jgi:site-specific recombinase XerD
MVSGVREPESGAMERLRDRMIQELRIRLMTERTGLLPGHVTEEDLKAYLDDLLVERHVAPSTYAQHVAAMRFFYTHLTDGSMGRVHEAMILKADDDEVAFRYLDHRHPALAGCRRGAAPHRRQLPALRAL